MLKLKFDEQTDTAPRRYELQDRYLEPTRTLLTSEGRKRRWVVT